MVEEVTLKPKFTIAYVIIVLATIVALALAAYLNFTGELRADFFTVFLLGILLLSFIALLSTFLKFVATTYTITDREVVCTEGLITKTKRSVPFTKIDNITVRNTIKDMVMGTGSVYIDTPGGPGSEIAMHYVDSAKIPLLEQTLKDLMHAKKPEEKVKEELDEPEERAVEKPVQEKPAKKPKKGKKH